MPNSQTLCKIPIEPKNTIVVSLHSFHKPNVTRFEMAAHYIIYVEHDLIKYIHERYSVFLLLITDTSYMQNIYIPRWKIKIAIDNGLKLTFVRRGEIICVANKFYLCQVIDTLNIFYEIQIEYYNTYNIFIFSVIKTLTSLRGRGGRTINCVEQSLYTLSRDLCCCEVFCVIITQSFLS